MATVGARRDYDHWTRYLSWFRWRYAFALDGLLAVIVFGPWWLPVIVCVLAVFTLGYWVGRRE